MDDMPIFQRVLEVGPNDRGEGVAMTLLWDGGEGALVIAEFDGKQITAEVRPSRLLANVHKLQEQASEGGLQVEFRSDALVRELEAAASARH